MTTYDRIKDIRTMMRDKGVKDNNNRFLISNDKNFIIKLMNENYAISMQYLINFTLYDQLNLLDDNKKCIFEDLDKHDECKIISIAKQIDHLSNELIEINDKVNKINESYKIYYKNFLKLIDDKVQTNYLLLSDTNAYTFVFYSKDVLIELFYDYYRQYILHDNKSSKHRKSSKNYEDIDDNGYFNEDNCYITCCLDNRKLRRNRKAKKSKFAYYIPIYNRFSVLSYV